MMKEIDGTTFEVERAGAIEPTVRVHAGVVWCGPITDGIGFDGWVIAFSDLERIYNVAQALRSTDDGQARIARNKEHLASVAG